MSQSTDGEISYGIKFEEDFEFPWDDDKYTYDIDDWWLEVLGYQIPFEVYDKDGNYINNERPEEKVINEYYKHRREFLEQNPVPIQLVNYCCSLYPEYIVAIPSTIQTANRGCPVELNINELTFTDEERYKLIEFCIKYLNLTKEQCDPKWYLTSYCD